MMSVCSVCLDDEVPVAFRCATSICVYRVCGSCVKAAFEDPTGANCGKCPMCKAPTAMKMVEALCGKGAVREVQRVLRSKVEFDVQQEHLRKMVASNELKDVHDRARELFNDLAERVLLKCPKCKSAFTDYEGCNALTCGIENCKASFCAICLQDCGADAHGHVRQVHGNLFDKAAFGVACTKRTKKVIDDFLCGLPDEPYELKQLIRNHVEKAGLTSAKSPRLNRGKLSAAFMAETRLSLNKALKDDRLSVLSDPEDDDYAKRGLRLRDISPRQAIPSDYQLQITRSPTNETVYEICVRFHDPTARWKEISLDDLSKDDADRPKVDCLVNVKQALRSAVVAFEGAKELYQTRSVQPATGVSLGDDEISVEFLRITRDGNVPSGVAIDIRDIRERDFRERDVNERDLRERGFRQRVVRGIIGINQNLRMCLLQKHVETTAEGDLMFEPLKHLVGHGMPMPIFSELITPVPPTLNNLNVEQRSVAHPLALKTAMEVAGPPGTGKTKTITELVRALLSCTECEIFVLSERNGAIDAISEKFAESCLKRNRRIIEGITDVPLWLNVAAYGAAAAVGESTKLFTLHEKLRFHPELVELRQAENDCKLECKALGERLRYSLSESIEGLNAVLPGNTDALRRSDIIRRNQENKLSFPWDIISALTSACTCIESLTDEPCLKEEMVDELVDSHSVLLENLINVRSDRANRGGLSWNRLETKRSMQYIALCFETVRTSPSFCAENAQEAQSRLRAAGEAIIRAEARVKGELLSKARLHLSTIGSSHNIQSDNDLSVAISALSLDDEIEHEPKRSTIVIFDESGCIPAYELLGLSRLGRTIEGLVLVGDKHQLPPYSAVQTHQGTHAQYRRDVGRAIDRHRRPPFGREKNAVVRSLLDVSTLTVDNAKVKLTTQYRVPRDIANLLNDCVYRGDYRTAPYCSVPDSGFRFVDVPLDRGRGAKKYINQNEIDIVIDLIAGFARNGIESVMILTPYKKQQRELQFKLKKMDQMLHNLYQVLTIDQCQGQEADFVILSLVQKPTPFLTKNRFNVALSRVRKRLYLLADKAEFRDASKNTSWGCASMAKGILALDGQDNNLDLDWDF